MPAEKPQYWYFPTPDPDVVIRCEYNADDDRYSKNCTSVNVSTLPPRVAVEMTRFSNAISKYS